MSKETNLPWLENPVMTSTRVDVLGASLPKADLANTSAEWLICQQQRPIHGPNMVPFPGELACKFTTLDLYHDGGNKDLSSLEYIYVLDVDLSSVSVMPLPAPTICGLIEYLIFCGSILQSIASNQRHFTAKKVQQWA